MIGHACERDVLERARTALRMDPGTRHHEESGAGSSSSVHASRGSAVQLGRPWSWRDAQTQWYTHMHLVDRHAHLLQSATDSHATLWRNSDERLEQPHYQQRAHCLARACSTSRSGQRLDTARPHVQQARLRRRRSAASCNQTHAQQHLRDFHWAGTALTGAQAS